MDSETTHEPHDNTDTNLIARARKTSSGSFRVQGVRTTAIEFRTVKPNGMYKQAHCNDCEFTYYIPPFDAAVECPRCHGTSIATVEKIGE